MVANWQATCKGSSIPGWAEVVNSDLVPLLVAFLVTSAALPIALQLLKRWKLIDRPVERSSHRIPTPRGAGTAQILGIGAAWAVVGWIPMWGVLGPILFGVLGLVDDIKPQRPLLRLGIQFLLGLATVAFFISTPFSDIASGMWFLAGAAFVVIMVNTANFMDGVNGISAVHGALLGAVYWIMLADVSPAWSAIAASLAGVSLAFLPWNWGRTAKLFLGDSGSYLLGSMTAVLAIAAWLSGISLLVAVAPVTIYCVDVCITLAIRATARKRIFSAHREHVYQKLTDEGLSHPKVSLVVFSFSLLAGITALAADSGIVSLPLILFILMILSAAYVLLPRIVGTRGLKPMR